MRKFNYKNCSVHAITTLLVALFTIQTGQAQGRINSNQTTGNNGQWGPTAVIATTQGSTYGSSKTNGFTITGTNGAPLTIGNYRMLKVTGTNSTDQNNGTFADLDDAIRECLQNNYQRIIILEGDYFVNQTIEVDFLHIPNDNPLNTINYPILPSATEVGNVGRITIEGEGFGTRISNATGFNGNIFEVKSNYNVIKNMSILAFDGYTGSCLALSQGAATYASNNTFENLFIGYRNMASNSSAGTAVGIRLNNGANNVFKNLIFNRLHTGVLVSNANNNHFQDLAFDNIVNGVTFSSGATANQNIFENLSLQGDSYNGSFIREIAGENNVFRNIFQADWNYNSTNAQPYITIATTAKHTTIENAQIGRAQNPTGTLHANYIVNNGKYTQLINCYGVNGDVNYIIGNLKDTDNLNAVSTTEILGRLNLTASDDTNMPTIADKRVLQTDANGFATWVSIAASPSNPWDYTAIKNIRMNNWAITGNDNATTLGANGLRLDNDGNVRIGTAAPVSGEGKLQVDGNFVSKKINTDGSIGDNQLTVKDGKVFIGKYNGALLTNSGDYNLLVNGKARVKQEVYVKGNDGTLTWPDYVFAKEYKLMSLHQVEQHIQEKGYLPNMPSAAEVEKDGIAMADMITRQQEKIEELTLYIIAMKKELEQIKANQKN